MFSILNELTLEKELHNYMTNNVFWTKREEKTTTKQKSKQNKSLPKRESTYNAAKFLTDYKGIKIQTLHI